MRIYYPEQKDLLFLSPYTVVYVGDKKTVIVSRLYETSVEIFCDEKIIKMFLACIQVGEKIENISKFFEQYFPTVSISEVLEEWMRKGILE